MRVTPDEVTKDDKGVIHVLITGTQNGDGISSDFFSAKAACDKFLVDNGVSRQEAAHDDIN